MSPAHSTGSTVTAIVSAPVTSRAIASSESYAGSSEAILQIQQPLGTVVNTYPGTVSGSQVSFANVTLPNGTFYLQVSNVRVNAAVATNPQITESLQVVYKNAAGQPLPAAFVLSSNGSSENVGYAVSSLSVSILQNASNQNIFYGGTTKGIPSCTGEPLPTSSSAAALVPVFTLNIRELFADAFKTLGEESGSLLGTVSGEAVGVPTQGTSLQVAFSNVPSAATIYLPIAITSGGTTFSLQGNGITPLTTPNALALLNPPESWPLLRAAARLAPFIQ
jgi:hypothetical protein